jgi:hypothetical protein
MPRKERRSFIIIMVDGAVALVFSGGCVAGTFKYPPSPFCAPLISRTFSILDQSGSRGFLNEQIEKDFFHLLWRGSS